MKSTIKRLFLGARVLSEPHSLLDALYLHNRSVIDDVNYAILVKSIMKVHIACATTREDIKILVFKPVFKCTPQIKLMLDGYYEQGPKHSHCNIIVGFLTHQ